VRRGSADKKSGGRSAQHDDRGGSGAGRHSGERQGCAKHRSGRDHGAEGRLRRQDHAVGRKRDGIHHHAKRAQVARTRDDRGGCPHRDCRSAFAIRPSWNRHSDVLEISRGRARLDMQAVGIERELRILAGVRTRGAQARVHDPLDGSIEPRQPHHHLVPRPDKRQAGRVVAFRRINPANERRVAGTEVDRKAWIDRREDGQHRRTEQRAKQPGHERPAEAHDSRLVVSSS
jgi:hypothetical protein